MAIERESFLPRSNLTGIYEPDNVLNITPLDLQLHGFSTYHFKGGGRTGKNARAATSSLGIPTHLEGSEDQVHHNAGKDAAFQCQMFLAVVFLSNEQYQAYTDGEEISDFLLLYFSGYIPYRANKLLLFILVLKRLHLAGSIDSKIKPKAKSYYIP